MLSYCDPSTFEEFVKDLKWKQFMDEDIGQFEKNNTLGSCWNFVKGKNQCLKCVYKTKLNKDVKLDEIKFVI